ASAKLRHMRIHHFGPASPALAAYGHPPAARTTTTSDCLRPRWHHAAALSIRGRRRPSATRINTVAHEQSIVRPSTPRLPKWTSRPARIGGETAAARLSGNAIIDVALANSVVEDERYRRPRHRHRAAAEPIEQDEERDRPERAVARDQKKHRER